MGSNIYENIFFMLGGIAFLMFGMKVMGSNLEQIAGNNMKKMLSKMTTNRFAGVAVGTAVTAIINSSTATTVMLVGFVNIGLLNLTQATSVIMGANIGTTITAQILSITGANFKISAYAALLSAFGIVLNMFAKKDKIKKAGNILLGVGLIFIGLEVMSMSVNEIIYDDDDVIRPLFVNILQGDHFPLLLIFIGIVLTAIVHSSAAITGILIALGGAISFNNAVFIILGSNIGTCVTSLVSSVGTSTNAKRTAVIHMLFNVLGCLICFVPLLVWNNEISMFIAKISGSMQRQIANFHTLFNILTTVVLLPFVNIFVKLVEKIVPQKSSEQEEKHRLTYIDERLLQTPAIAVGNTKNELIKMAQIAKENLELSTAMLFDENFDETALIKDNEKALNTLNKCITEYLTKLMGKDITTEDEKKVGSYYHVVMDIERVGDYAENIMEYALKLRSEDISLSDSAVEELKDMTNKVYDLFDVSIKVFDERNPALLEQVDYIEESVDKASVDLEDMHIRRVQQGCCNAQAGSIYLQTVSNLERIGDHITNIAFSIKGYIRK